MTTHQRRHRLTFLPVALGALLILGALLAGGALAESGDMSGMPGMTDEEMQNMATPGATVAADGHEADSGADAHGAMAGSSVNWLVIGGFLILVVGSTFAALVTKRYLRRRILSGELAAAGVEDV
jgi:hypothetical protein